MYVRVFKVQLCVCACVRACVCACVRARAVGILFFCLHLHLASRVPSDWTGPVSVYMHLEFISTPHSCSIWATQGLNIPHPTPHPLISLVMVCADANPHHVCLLTYWRKLSELRSCLKVMCMSTPCVRGQPVSFHHVLFRYSYCTDHINPFTAPACKMSGLKDGGTCQQTVYFPVL